MLDLQPIKDRLCAASQGPWAFQGHAPDAAFLNHAREDLTALVAEVERLRGAIKAHRSMGGFAHLRDQILWEALNA